MRGRRRPIEPGQDPTTVLRAPGDYCGPIVGFTGDKPAVFFLLPVAEPPDTDDDPPWWHMRHVTSPPHVFRECDDGSLEIRESIGALGRDLDAGYVWHGYLDEGHTWRTV